MIEQANFLLLLVDGNNKNVKKHNETNSSFHIFLGERIFISNICTFPRDTGGLLHMVTTQPIGVFWLAAGSSLFTGVGIVCLLSLGHGDSLIACRPLRRAAKGCAGTLYDTCFFIN